MGEDQRGRVVGVLPSPTALQAAVDRLETAGFDHAQFGVLAPQAALHDWRSSEAVARDPEPPTAALHDPESAGAARGGLLGGAVLIGALTAAGGPILAGGGLGVALASALTGGGAGALVAGLFARGFHRLHAQYIEDQIARGGLVLWILTRNVEQEDEALAALRASGATEATAQVSLKP